MSTTSMLFPRIQSSQLDGRAQSFRHRQVQLHRLYEALTTSSSKTKLAIQADAILSSTEVDFELTQALTEFRIHYESLDLKKDLESARKIETGVDNVENTRPVGVVYIIPSRWNLTFSVISALGAAIAAGSCVIVELPETLTQTSAVLRTLLTDALNTDTFAIARTRPPPEFTRKCMLVNQTAEKIQPSEWLQVLSAPSTSGSVAIVDRTANVDEAAQAVACANFSFSGKSAYAPRIVLVNEFVVEKFLSGLISRMPRGLTEKKLDSQANGHVGQVKGDRRNVKEVSKMEDTRTLVSGSSGTILRLSDPKASLLPSKPNEGTILVIDISSIDDALNYLKGQPLAASFIFAQLPEANYASRHINSHICTINHIPVELLVGPLAPIHPSLPGSPSLRYSTAMFKTPAPQYLPRQTLLRSLTDAQDQRLVRKLMDTAMQPLPPIVQADGHKLNFFGQAIFVGFGMGVTFITTVTVGSLWFAFTQYRGGWSR